MRKFSGYYKNEHYSVGCNGKTVYIYDSKNKEIAKFSDFPYAYNAAFMPNKNIIAVKSTEGSLGFYDLEKLSLIKLYTITKSGAQDEGFAFSPDGKFFYNIEKPKSSTQTELAIYETESFTKVDTLFADNEKMVLDCLEFDPETGVCYVLGFMRNEEGIIDYGFAAIFDRENKTVTDIRRLDHKTYEYFEAYKSWELDGFTEKGLESNFILSELSKIKKTSIKEVFDKCTDSVSP